MKLELTSEEQRLQIWQFGDFLEIRDGRLVITGNGTVRVNAQLEQTYIQFIFEEDDGLTHNCSKFFTSPSQLPNGPALYIRYMGKREGGNLFAEPYALISLVNGAWCHLFPLEKSDLITETERFKEFYTRIVKRATPLTGGLLGRLPGEIYGGECSATQGYAPAKLA
jgi:hypothetical protein